MRFLRRIHVVLTLGALFIVGSISLSDYYVPKASRTFSTATSDASTSASDRIDLPFSVPDLPFGWDTLTHFTLWFGVGVLAAGLVRRFYHIPVLWFLLVGLSAFIEVAQQRWTNGRSMEISDLIANGLGLFAGLGVGLFILFVEVGLSTFARKIVLWRRPTTT